MPTHSIRSHATYTHQVILLPRNLLLSKHSHPSLVRLSRVSRSIAISTGDEGLWTEVLQHQFDVYGHEGGQKALGTNDSTYLQTSLSLSLNSCAYTHTRHDRKSDHRPQNSLLLTNIQCKNCMWAYRGRQFDSGKNSKNRELKSTFEYIMLPAKLLDYFLWSKKATTIRRACHFTIWTCSASRILVAASGRSFLTISLNICTIMCAVVSYVHYMTSKCVDIHVPNSWCGYRCRSSCSNSVLFYLCCTSSM